MLTAQSWKHRGIAKLVRHGSLNPACVGSSPATPAIWRWASRKRCFFRIYGQCLARLKKSRKKSRLLLTNGCNSCNIIQVAARYRPTRKQDNVPWLETLAECGTASFQTKKKNKKVLDSPKEMRYNKWVAWSESFERQSCSLKTKQCNMNHLWFKPDVFKNIDWLWT